MIIHKLNNGRLGNQLFQISAALAHAKKMGTIAQFPPWQYNKYFINGIDDKLDTTYDCRFNNIFHNPYYGFDFEYKPIPEETNLILHGFFQSEKYFQNDKDIIINSFKPKNEFLQIVKQAGKEWINLQNTVAIHVRRGDYIEKQGAHPNISLGSYYENSIYKMIEKVNDPLSINWVVFSDDIEWCKRKFNTHFMYYSEGNSEMVDLFLMAQCKHHIIANSSFSWWGSWLAKNMFGRTGTTIAPKTWFGPELAHYNTKDLYCNDWIKI